MIASSATASRFAPWRASRPASPAKRSAAPSRRGADPDLQRVIDSLRQRFQTRVRIQGDASRGRIEIEFFGDDDLTRITGLLLGKG